MLLGALIILICLVSCNLYVDFPFVLFFVCKWFLYLLIFYQLNTDLPILLSLYRTMILLSLSYTEQGIYLTQNKESHFFSFINCFSQVHFRTLYIEGLVHSREKNECIL
uniref:Uncharacterized protein n=1 Tax=Cacopsylla melanoneura TaxID=428564 RepID=A0A8D8THC8_9HEMI